MSQQRAFLCDYVTGKHIGTITYDPNAVPDNLRELVDGLDTPATYTIEFNGVMHTGVCVRSKDPKRSMTQ